jgi:hypothetical protein
MPPCSYSFNVVSDHPQLNLGLFSFRGENAVEQFLKDLLACQDDIKEILTEIQPMIITQQQEQEFNESTTC